MLRSGSAGLSGTTITMCYGSFYQDDSSTTITIPGANQDVIVDGFTIGQVNGVTFQNGQELVIQTAGKYLITWGTSVETLIGGNQEVECTVGINGVRSPQASAHRTVAGINDSGAMGGTCILDLSIDNLVQLVIRNETNANNLLVTHANLSLLKVE